MDVHTHRSVSLRARLASLRVAVLLLVLIAIAASSITMRMWQDSVIDRGEARTVRA